MQYLNWFLLAPTTIALLFMKIEIGLTPKSSTYASPTQKFTPPLKLWCTQSVSKARLRWTQ